MADPTTTQLAERLGVSRRRTLDLLRTGKINGRQLANDIWLADSDAVARYEVSAHYLLSNPEKRGWSLWSV